MLSSVLFALCVIKVKEIVECVGLTLDDFKFCPMSRADPNLLLKHLDAIGLLSFDNLSGYRRIHLPEIVTIYYYGTPIKIKFSKPSDNELGIGKIILSKIGQELAPISGSKPIEGFLDYVVGLWVKQELVIYSDWPRKQVQATCQ